MVDDGSMLLVEACSHVELLLCVADPRTEFPLVLPTPQRLASSPQASTQHYILPMPKWQERESTLLKRLQQHEGVEGASSSAAATVAAAVSTSAAASPAAGAPGPRLIVGEPIPAQPGMDLLGSEMKSINGDHFGQMAAQHAPAQPQAPPKPSNPVDLLADLLSDVVTTGPPAPAAPAGFGMATQGSGGFGMATQGSGAFGMHSAFPPAAPAAPAPAHTVPFAAAFPPQPAAAPAYPGAQPAAFPSTMQATAVPTGEAYFTTAVESPCLHSIDRILVIVPYMSFQGRLGAHLPRHNAPCTLIATTGVCVCVCPC